MEIEKGIRTAIEYEKKVCGVYGEAVEKASGPIARKVFQALEGEERGHVAYLEHCLESWTRTGALEEAKLATVVPSKAAIERGIERLRGKLPASAPGPDEAAMLRRALEVEVETSAFYESAVSQLPPEGRKLFARFLEIEQGHRCIVQAELDAVTGLGFWFDFQEFSLENA